MDSSERERLIVARGPHVRIREKQAGDALRDWQWRRDPEVTRYDGSPPVEPVFGRYLVRYEYELLFADPRWRTFAIETADGEHIGNIMYYNADAARGTAELGISIGSAAHRGRGLGTETVMVFLRYIWAHLPVRVVELHAYEWNTRAHAAFRNAGFAPVARVYRAGHWYLRMEARREWWLHRFGDEQPTGNAGS